VWPSDPLVKSNPILGFSLAAGNLFHQGLGISVSLGTVFGILLVEGFVITTLDAAVRLNRYLFEELWVILFKNPKPFLKNYWFNSLLTVIFMFVLAYSNAFTVLWPIFGTANQLLAALALITVASWLVLKGKKYLFALFPALFMLATTITALVILLWGYVENGNYILIVVDVFLFLLSLGVATLAVKVFLKKNKKRNEFQSIVVKV
jgi:carbon starvation protein